MQINQGYMGDARFWVNDPEPTTRVWVNGTFDVLHAGHIHLFQHAKWVTNLGEVFVRVGIDNDERVAQRKGPNRPINTLPNRVSMLRAIRYIDDVVVFGSDDELRDKIREFNPHIMVIGDDYPEGTIIGEEFIPRIIRVPKFGGLSTTKIVNRG